MTWRRLPASNRLFVDERHGRAGRTVRTLAGTSDWRRDIVDRLGVAALVTVGARALSAAPAIEWPPAGLVELEQALHDELPGLRLVGVAIPRQAGRARLSAVGRMTGDAVVVKLGAPDTTLDIEASALELLAKDPLPGISTPTPLASGRLVIGAVPVTYLVTNAVALGRQRAAIDHPLRTFEHDLAQRLAALPREARDADSDRADLVPAHGDLTPWNLRRTGRGLALFDWESAGWAEPGSDLARYRAACDEVRLPWARSAIPHHDLLRARR